MLVKAFGYKSHGRRASREAKMTKWMVLVGVMAGTVGLSACAPTPATPGAPTTGGTRVTTTGTSGGSTGSGSTPLDDDPTGVHSGTSLGILPPPPPLAGTAKTDGETDSQDLANAMNLEQDMDVYAASFDKGSGIVAAGGGNIVATGGGNIVATGGGNIVAAGGGNYRLAGVDSAVVQPVTVNAGGLTAVTDAHATGVAGASGAVMPANTVTTIGHAGGASPAPTGDKRPHKLAAAKYRPAFDALSSPQAEAKVQAARQVLTSRLQLKARKLTETSALGSAVRAAKWATNPDGTLTKDVEVTLDKQINGQDASRHMLMEATVHPASNAFVHQQCHIDTTFANGTTRTIDREVVLVSDGGHTIDLTMVTTTPKGATRTVHWTKSVDLDGNVSGTGTLEVKDADGNTRRSASITLDGTEDTPSVRAEDPNSHMVSKVSVGDDGTPTAEIHDASGSTDQPRLDGEGAPAMDPSDDQAATGAATASGSATPAPTAPPSAVAATTAPTATAAPAATKAATATAAATASATVKL